MNHRVSHSFTLFLFSWAAAGGGALCFVSLQDGGRAAKGAPAECRDDGATCLFLGPVVTISQLSVGAVGRALLGALLSAHAYRVPPQDGCVYSS